jgi:REP element-mobilizing transposase RayT
MISKELHPAGVPERIPPMGSTFFSLHYHIVFSTKDRRPLIRHEWRPRMHSYLGGIINGMDGVPEIVGGIENHVHLLVSLRPVHRLADVLRDLKKESTNWVKENFDPAFSWQEGYSAFTVSPSATKSVSEYIANQEAHHRTGSFVDELRELLGRAGIEYDEKYLL